MLFKLRSYRPTYMPPDVHGQRFPTTYMITLTGHQCEIHSGDSFRRHSKWEKEQQGDR